MSVTIFQESVHYYLAGEQTWTKNFMEQCESNYLKCTIDGTIYFVGLELDKEDIGRKDAISPNCKFSCRYHQYQPKPSPFPFCSSI